MVKFSKVQGVTLVELMIALLLGSIMTAGLVTLFSSNKAVFRYQDRVAQLNDQGGFAMEFITAEIQKAGHPGPNYFTMEGEVTNDNTQLSALPIDYRPLRNRGRDDVANSFDGNNYRNDVLDVAYNSLVFNNAAGVPQPVTVCTGVSAPLGSSSVRSQFYVNDNGELVCQGFYHLDPQGIAFSLDPAADAVGAEVWRAIGDPAALVANVESFQVRYLVDLSFERNAFLDIPPVTVTTATCPSTTTAPTRVVSASHLEAVLRRAQTPPPLMVGPVTNQVACKVAMTGFHAIRGIEVSLLVRSAESVQQEYADIDSVTFTVADKVYDKNSLDLTDGRVRRVYNTVVRLLNNR